MEYPGRLLEPSKDDPMNLCLAKIVPETYRRCVENAETRFLSAADHFREQLGIFEHFVREQFQVNRLVRPSALA